MWGYLPLKSSYMRSLLSQISKCQCVIVNKRQMQIMLIKMTDVLVSSDLNVLFFLNFSPPYSTAGWIKKKLPVFSRRANIGAV